MCTKLWSKYIQQKNLEMYLNEFKAKEKHIQAVSVSMKYDMPFVRHQEITNSHLKKTKILPS